MSDTDEQSEHPPKTSEEEAYCSDGDDGFKQTEEEDHQPYRMP